MRPLVKFTRGAQPTVGQSNATPGAAGSRTNAGANRVWNSVSQPKSKPANYLVQAPIHVSGHSQRIRATISGSPQVAGSVEISRTGGGNAFISNLKVDQQHRRHGVGAKLINAAVSAARRQGFSSARLEARPSDNAISPQALVAMYRRQGFKTVGRSNRGNPLMERKL